MNRNIGGKVAMAKGPGQFNLEAKEQYQSLDDEQMEELKRKCQAESSLKVMSSKEIKADGRKIFKKLQNGVGLVTYKLPSTLAKGN